MLVVRRRMWVESLQNSFYKPIIIFQEFFFCKMDTREIFQICDNRTEKGNVLYRSQTNKMDDFLLSFEKRQQLFSEYDTRDLEQFLLHSFPHFVMFLYVSFFRRYFFFQYE